MDCIRNEELAVKMAEPTAEERLKWIERDFEKCARQCRQYEEQVKALSQLYAIEVFHHNMAKDELHDLQKDNKKYCEAFWKLESLLFNEENKVRMNKEIAEQVRAVIKRF